MGDFNYGGTDEESAEIKKFNNELVSLQSYFNLRQGRSPELPS
jgi:hypothetical protein